MLQHIRETLVHQLGLARQSVHELDALLAKAHHRETLISDVASDLSATATLIRLLAQKIAK